MSEIQKKLEEAKKNMAEAIELKDSESERYWLGYKRALEFSISITNHEVNIPESKSESNRIVKVVESLNRDKVLDEGIFLALCGLDHCRINLEITGVVRLEMAHHKIGRVIDKINEKLNNREFPKDSNMDETK